MGTRRATWKRIKRIPRKYLTQKTLKRFWSYVTKTESCWLWTGTISRNGYGRFWMGKRGMPDHAAHRVAYEIEVGRISPSLTLDHLCRVRNCVNPKHLEPVTMRENVWRGKGFAAINRKKTACPKGHPYKRFGYLNGNGGRECRLCCRASHRRSSLNYFYKNKAAGLCTGCGGTNNNPAGLRCVSCRDKHRAIWARYKDKLNHLAGNGH
jgi:hypothetical protein